MVENKVEKTKKIRKVVPKKTALKKIDGYKADVFDMEGKKIEEISLDKKYFGVNVSPRLVAQYVRVYEDRQHQGTRRVKTRADVIGSTAKIFRQKGTGRARHGSRKAPIFVGGGVAHGPQPKGDSLTISKKQKKLVFYGALTMQYKNRGFIFMKGLDKVQPKTKAMSDVLKKNDLDKTNKLLLVYSKLQNKDLILSARNIAGLSLKNAGLLNAMDLLKAKKILMTVESLDYITQHENK